MELDEQATEAGRIAREIAHPLIAGHSPEMQGAVILDLAATWFAGHAPAIRQVVLKQWLDTLPALIEVNEKIMFGDRGHPGG